jgi:hypothetical protein
LKQFHARQAACVSQEGADLAADCGDVRRCAGAAPGASGTPAAGAHRPLSGQVVADSNGLGLRRARVVIHPLEAGRPAVGVLADEEGKFEIRDIAPGAYSLVAERDGYLPNSAFQRGGLRMP